MAELRPHYIDVDLKKNTQYNVPVVTQNDTATHFIVGVTDDGLTDPELLDAYQEITMTSQRPDGESFYLTGTRIPGTNEIEFHLGTDETAFSGSVLASLQFYLVEDASRYTSAQFRYDVKKDLTTNYTPTQREETLVEVVLKEGPGVIQEAKDAKVAVDGALVELEQDKTAAIDRLDEVTEENKTVFRQPVNTFADLATTYPNPEHGTTVRVTSEAASYRYSNGNWVKTDEYNPTAIDQVTAQLADTSQKVAATESKVKVVEATKPSRSHVDNLIGVLASAYPSVSELPIKPNRLDESRVNITNMEEDWVGPGGLISRSTDVTFQGRSTIKFSKLAGSTSPRGYNTYAMPPHVDLSDADYIELWYFVDRPPFMASTSRILLYSDAGTGTSNAFRADIRFHIAPDSYKHNGYDGWRRIRINKADFYVEKGTPNWADISSVEIALASTADDYFEFYLAQIDGVKLSKGVVSIDFDDARISAYTNALPIMKEYGLNGTMYVITGWAETEGFMSWEQIAEMHNEGWFIGNHTHTHPYLAQQAPEEIARQFDESQRILRERGYNAGSYFISAPYGSWSPMVSELARERFVYTRSGRVYPEWSSFPLDDLTLARSHGTTDQTTFENIKAVIDEAIHHKRWTPILFHDIFPDTQTLNTAAMHESTFRQILEYIVQKQNEGVLEVMNVGEAVLYYHGYNFKMGNDDAYLAVGDEGPLTIKMVPGNQYLI